MLGEQVLVDERQLDGVGDLLDLLVQAAHVLVGDVGHLLEHQLLDLGIDIADAREVVDMTDNSLAPLRRKRNSSVRVCANLIGEGLRPFGVTPGSHFAHMWADRWPLAPPLFGASFFSITAFVRRERPMPSGYTR